MDYDPTSQRETLLESCPEATALRTHHLLIAARLVFLFAHGVLVASAALAMACAAQEETSTSWWLIFLPAWLGNLACIGIVISSWFASCPYIQKCLEERQARYGEENPSILTELLPEIVLSIFGLLFLITTLVGEILFCWHLERERNGLSTSLARSASVLMIAGFSAAVHGVIMRSNGELFMYAGGGVFMTFAVAVEVPGGFTGDSSWLTVLPALLAVLGIVVTSAIRLHHYRAEKLLSREEQLLRVVELAVLAGVVLALLLAMVGLLLEPEGLHAGVSFPAGALSGGGLCLISALRVRMVYVEARSDTSIRERLILLHARRCQSEADEDDEARLSSTDSLTRSADFYSRRGSGSATMPSPSTGSPIRRTRSAVADEMEEDAQVASSAS
mmetsp:Transcript_62147/g.148239  ORF Transcript_62147/g.148239 Transcript_62147/m.148239 type:complete len:389 (+) Transcript_62147:178-1344(+)